MLFRSYTIRHTAWSLPAGALRAMLLLAVGGMVAAPAMSQFSPADRPLPERFSTPPARARILKIVHSLPDDPAAQDNLIHSLLAQGFGGMVTNVSFADYLESNSKWTAFVRGVQQAKQAGLALWLYDERGYPSGNAGGLTMRDHPEWEARGRMIADAVTHGDLVALELPPGDLIRAVALPVAEGKIQLDHGIDLSAQVSERKLSWPPPDGVWHVMAITEGPLYEGTHAAVSLADKLPYINLLLPEPAVRFLEVTHDRYAERLGDDLGKWFIATFTDEPSLMSLYMQRQPWRVLPWAANLPYEFARRRGYALEPMFPALVANAGQEGSKARYDFWQTVAELTAENFFGQIQTWCRHHNVPSGGHLLLEEPFLTHVPLYGDFFRCARRLDAPSIDCLTSIPEEVPWFIARMISSIAELEGRSVTMCETSDHSQRYRTEGDTRPVREITEDEIRGTCNRLIMNGINTITSYYSFHGLSNEQMNRLNTWIGRCCTMLEGGHQVADIALLYPIESAWVHFEPSRHWVSDAPAEARRIEQVYRGAAENLCAARRDFTFIDARALADARVESGVLRHGALEWRVVILPGADTLPLEAWENLARFWRSGGAVVALSVRPANSEAEFPSPRVRAIAGEIFGAGAEGIRFNTNDAAGAGLFLPAGSEALLSRVLDALLEPDIRVGDTGAPIHATLRRIDGHEVYFVTNDGRESWEGTITFAANGAAEQWNPATGEVAPASQSTTLRLDPFGGTFFRFDAPGPSRRRLAVETALPGLTRTLLPSATPVAGAGKFVAAEITPAGDAPSAWDIKGTIRKGQVDTFLFATFTYAPPIDLRNAAYLVVTARVPENQKTPTPLRAILRDVSGLEYIANTERTLADPGAISCFVGLNQFERAGWNTAPGGALNLAAITDLRVGWGGYLGAEGETIEFTLRPPEAAVIE